ncbi:hypothetical protein Tco_0981647 [Tanacetum coccineum]
MGEPLRLGYGALRRREIALGEGWMPSVFEVVPPAQTTPFTQWPSGSFIFLLAHPIVPSHILSTYDISDCFHRLLASPIRLEMRGFLTELGAQMENQELRLQIAKERHARLDLAEVINSMRRGQDPRGDV